MRPVTNALLLQRLDGIRQILMAHHAAGNPLPSAARGDEREVVVREFLAKVFPSAFRFGTGAVTDSTGSISGQLDVVVEWPFFPSFPTPGGTERLYLAESVAFIVEVKSNLAAQWNQIQASVEKLRPIVRQWKGHLAVGDNGLEHHAATGSRIPYIAVGFEGFKSRKALRERLESTPENARPDCALVIESGAYAGPQYRTQGIGSPGLLGLCIDMSHFATNVSARQGAPPRSPLSSR